MENQSISQQNQVRFTSLGIKNPSAKRIVGPQNPPKSLPSICPDTTPVVVMGGGDVSRVVLPFLNIALKPDN